ncbi:restriction endonuclease subunit S [Metapseudomonas otitidis]|uniref:restriction endonuclease subunit S n=1 Tax=Metapseudomonas otitidis TaxID=319939 RepID=UPI00280B550A|nr:restriction endonuclease subunit S [Pseudomonas otitidis]
MKSSTLGDVAEFVRGLTFKPEDVVPFGTEGSIVCFRTKNVQSELDVSDVISIPESLVKNQSKMINGGDIIVSSANSWNLVGKCSWVFDLPWNATFGGFVSVLRAKPDKVFPRFLYRWFSSPNVQAVVRNLGNKTTSISNLNIERCLALPIEIPSMNEQKRIAAILDKADALRAKRRKALEQLDALAQAIFIEMFGDPTLNPKQWGIGSIGELLESASYGSSAKSGAEGSYPILRMGNVTNDGKIDLGDLKYIDLAEQEAEKYLVRAGDVLFNRTNSAELVGKSAIYRFADEVAYAGYLVRLRVNSKCDPEYLAAFLNTPHAKRVLRSMCKSIVGMANINAKEVQSIRIAIPPIELQKEFGKRVRAIEGKRVFLEKSRGELDALFSSLQHRAFRGEL